MMMIPHISLQIQHHLLHIPPMKNVTRNVEEGTKHMLEIDSKLQTTFFDVQCSIRGIEIYQPTLSSVSSSLSYHVLNTGVYFFSRNSNLPTSIALSVCLSIRHHKKSINFLHQSFFFIDRLSSSLAKIGKM